MATLAKVSSFRRDVKDEARSACSVQNQIHPELPTFVRSLYEDYGRGRFKFSDLDGKPAAAALEKKKLSFFTILESTKSSAARSGPRRKCASENNGDPKLVFINI